MINANELRLGNWVSYAGFTVKIIGINSNETLETTIPPDGYIDEWNPINEYNPIPLTPEILEKAGFSHSHDPYGGYLSKPNKHGERMRIRIRWQTEDYFYTPNELSNPLPVLYVHQLQNLYFALTGEELEINL